MIEGPQAGLVDSFVYTTEVSPAFYVAVALYGLAGILYVGFFIKTPAWVTRAARWTLFLAFLAHTVHIIGKRRWNRRGAMVTDRYQHIEYHESVEGFIGWAGATGLDIIGIDIIDSSVPIETANLPKRSVFVFGQEGPGLTDEIVRACDEVYEISQFGSTRSINVGVASGIAMHTWIRQHAISKS